MSGSMMWVRCLPIALIALALTPHALFADGDDVVVPGQVVVKLMPGADINDFTARYAAEWGVGLLDAIDSRRTYLVSVFPGDEEEFTDVAVFDADVERIQPNYTGRDTRPDPDTQSIFVARTAAEYTNQPSIVVIGSDLVHGISTGAGVVVAVIDSGVDLQHEVLAPRIVPGGWNFVAENGDVQDRREGVDSNGDGFIDGSFGHGTLVAGLIARVAPEAGILPLKVMDSDGLTDTFNMVEAIYYAIDAGADLINLSMGTTVETFVLEEAVLEARAKGVIIVTSVGNEDTSSPVRYPAAYNASNVLAVCATDIHDVRAAFSNYGAHVDMAAPGVDVVSTAPDNAYGETGGTSMSAPLVAGTVALVRAAFPDATPSSLRSRVTRSALPIDLLNDNYAGELGWGRLDAHRAVTDGGAQPGNHPGGPRAPKSARRVP